MRRISHYASLLFVAAWLALFVYLVAQTGVSSISERLRLVGWGFVVLVLLSGARQAIRAIAWQRCMEPKDRPPGLLHLFGLRLVGEAFTDTTPAGPLLGESVKVWAGSKYMSVELSAASVAIENLIYGLASTLFISGGVAVLLFATVVPKHFRVMAEGISAFLLLLATGLGFVIGKRKPWLASMLDWLKFRNARWPVPEKYERDIRNFEANINNFFGTRRRTSLVVLTLELLASLTGIAEVDLILKTTTLHASVLAAYLVEVANRVAHVVFLAPLGFGTEEAAAAGTLRALGYSVSEGVSLTIIRKTRTVFWTGVGLLLAARWSISGSENQALARRRYSHHEAIDCQRG